MPEFELTDLNFLHLKHVKTPSLMLIHRRDPRALLRDEKRKGRRGSMRAKCRLHIIVGMCFMKKVPSASIERS